MTIIIDEKEYSGEAVATPNRLNILINEDIETAFGWNKEMTVNVGGIEYTVKALAMIIKNDSLLQVEWEKESDIAALEKQLHEKQEELEETETKLSDRLAELGNIRSAIAELGAGVPTLSKLISFLNAVKEAIHYDI